MKNSVLPAREGHTIGQEYAAQPEVLLDTEAALGLVLCDGTWTWRRDNGPERTLIFRPNGQVFNTHFVGRYTVNKDRSVSLTKQVGTQSAVLHFDFEGGSFHGRDFDGKATVSGSKVRLPAPANNGSATDAPFALFRYTWERQGGSDEVVTFVADGSLNHTHFKGAWKERSDNSVELTTQSGKKAYLYFDASYSGFCGTDFDGTRAIWGRALLK